MNRPPQLSVLVAALFLAAVPRASSAADPALLGLADPASNFVIGVDVRALAASPLAQEALVRPRPRVRPGAKPWGRWDRIRCREFMK